MELAERAGPIGFVRRFLERGSGFDRAIVLVVAAAVLCVWIATLERVRYEKAEASEHAWREATNLAIAAEHHLLGMLDAVAERFDIILRAHDRGGDLQLPALFDDAGIVSSPYVGYVLVDEHGDAVAASDLYAHMNFADRDYFAYHRANRQDGMHIGAVVIAKISGDTIIPFSRRIDKADGSFGGVVVAAVQPEYFAAFFRKFDIGRHGVVALVGTDGFARVRRTGDSIALGVDVRQTSTYRGIRTTSNGTLLSPGAIDGVLRYVSYRTLGRYPVAVQIGLAESEVLREFNERVVEYYVAASVTTAALCLVAIGFIGAARRGRRTSIELLKKEARFRATFDQAAVGIAHIDVGGRLLKANGKLCELLGYGEAEVTKLTIADLTHPHDQGAVYRLIGALAERGSATPSEAIEVLGLRKDGSTIWVSITASLVRDDEDRPDYLAAMVQDIDARKRAEAALHESNEQFRQLVDHIPETFWIIDAETGKLVYLSPAFERIAGVRFDSLETASREWLNTVHPADRERALATYHNLKSTMVDHPLRIVRPDGTIRWAQVRGYPVLDAEGRLYRIAGTLEDTTERRELVDQLQYHAHYDALTGLPNRVLCLDRLKQALSQAKRKQWLAAVLFLDLDRFKVVNDTLGHTFGDQLLRLVSQRFSMCMRAGDTVARFGGDEFAVVLPELAQVQDAGVVAQRILQTLAAPFSLDGHEVFVTASIGIAAYPNDGADSDTLLRNADAAMFSAKALGKNNCQFYTAAMNERALERLMLESSLRRALERDEFVLHLQAKVGIASGAIVGCEALLRWQVPGNGLIAPGRFIPMLEESGLIVPVGEWVIRSACAQIRAWKNAGVAPVPISVNLSPRQFHQQNIAAVVENALREFDLEPGLLELEITEGTAMHDAEDAIVTLTTLKALGVKLAIDDFGTGYSSLSYLKRFPVDALKLDRSFVNDLPDDGEDAAIARAVIGLAHSLDLHVVAEGVETQQQLAFLAANGCEIAQGYYLSRPMPAAQFAQLLARRPRLPAALESASATLAR